MGDGGDVVAVGSEHVLQDVAGFGDVGAGGDDADRVALTAAGGGDVQAAPGRFGAGQGDRCGDGVGLPAVLGGGVAEPHVLADVVDRQLHAAVSLLPGHGE